MDRPRTLTITAALVALQAAAFATWGAVELIRALVGHPNDKQTAVMLGVLVLIISGGVFFAAYGLWHMKRWAQAPTYLVQFFSVILAMGQLTKLPAMMIPLLIVGLSTLVAVSLQPSRDALGGI
jgi:hypothetical protein